MKTANSSTSLSLNLRTLQLGGALGWVDVSAMECELLQAFSSADFQRLNVPQMLQRVGKLNNEQGKNALGVQMVRLRKKLEKAGAPAPTIKSIRGVGYQLCVPLHLLSSSPPAGYVLTPPPTFAMAEREPSNP